MRAYLGLAMMTVCVAALGGGFPAPAHPDDLDAARLLSDSKRLLQEQQEIERKLANSQARTEELRLERERMSREAERINNERQTTRDTCLLLHASCGVRTRQQPTVHETSRSG